MVTLISRELENYHNHEMNASKGCERRGKKRRSSPHRHCEERLRRSNPDCLHGEILDCFAALAMTKGVETPETITGCCARRTGVGRRSLRRHCEERSDEAIQAAAAERFWIASLRSQ
ncbi:hypothetical protein RAD16_36420 [Bradyrhizobium sp. 18BD]